MKAPTSGNTRLRRSARMSRHLALHLISTERARQETLKQVSDMGMSEPEKLICILEELGEVSRHVLARSYITDVYGREDSYLLTELSRVAALCCAWMERLIQSENDNKDVMVFDDLTLERRKGERRIESKTGAELTNLGIEDRRDFDRRVATRGDTLFDHATGEGRR